MQTRPLGKTGLQLPILSFGASSLGAEFRNVTLDEVMKSVHVALECGLNFIDTSPFYGRGMSEVLLGYALRGVPRDSYTLCTKLGRYDLAHFDFSAKRVAESVDVSLQSCSLRSVEEDNLKSVKALLRKARRPLTSRPSAQASPA